MAKPAIDPLHTPLCDMLGVELPIIAFTHCREVAVEAINAGGFAVLGEAMKTSDEIVENLGTPVVLTSPPGDARLFVVEKEGTIVIVEAGVLLPVPFLVFSLCPFETMLSSFEMTYVMPLTAALAAF